MRVFIDCDVLLDVGLDRAPFLSFPSAAWERGRGKLRFPDRRQRFRGWGCRVDK
uniref:Uncharacterized protein n=1 Tax=Candidatus Kentrum sp. DK TaxID=2126562 RepID=A0A450S5N2_9GAMM|nr:MAG: hypothetical protein BECKDK2373B_GA0170837_10168 [Candidatus Kentron sp. DK]